MPTISLQVNCGHLVPATLGSHYPTEFRVPILVATSPTVIADLQETVTSELLKDAYAPLNNIFVKDSVSTWRT